ncbi:Ras guanyl-releasing protein 3 [Nymphon striatum]|nr:Ras guanyl-releasing protein 3 [Nymphon striatum]
MVTMTEQQRCVVSHDLISSPQRSCFISTSDLSSCYTRHSVKKHSSKLILEGDKPILPGIHVKAATLDTLVELCVNFCDPVNGYSENESNLPRVLFLMHKWFTTSEELANQYWIHSFPIHFDTDAKLAATLRDFQLQLRENDYDVLTDVVDISNVPSYDWMRKISVRSSVRKHSRKVSLVFNHLEAYELADHVTYLEHKVMRRISFPDFKKYAIEGTPKDITKLERSIALFNGLSQWVQCMVLSKNSPHQRAEVVVKFVNIAKRLRDLQNFNSLMAVIGGLSHSAIARLTRTMMCVPAETQRTLKEMTELLSSTANFSNYRKALSESKGFRIPILGVHMKDLISLQVALPDSSNTNGDMINFRKIAQLSIIFQELAEMRNSVPPIDANIDLINTLRLSLDLVHTEDEIYNLSLQKEPRSSSTSSPTRPAIMFADWAAGVNVSPDPVTIEKHTHAMIEAVFENYDHDRDGYISKEEFNAISENFPFSEPFYLLDADRAILKKYKFKLELAKSQDPDDSVSAFVDDQRENLDLPIRQNGLHAVQVKQFLDVSGNGYFKEQVKSRFISWYADEVAGHIQAEGSSSNLYANLDGKISKTEMKNHFLGVNSCSLKSRFKHGFHETTYFKPTFCAHCTGLLWGIIKQGYKCRDCGINAHKHCKDLVVIECQRRNTSSSSCSSRSNSFAGSDGVAAKIMFKYHRKKKTSLNDDDSFIPPKGVEYRTCKCDQETHTIVVTEHDLSEVQVSELRSRLSKVQARLADKGLVDHQKRNLNTKTLPVSHTQKNEAQKSKLQSNNFLHPTSNGHSTHHEKHRSLST